MNCDIATHWHGHDEKDPCTTIPTTNSTWPGIPLAASSSPGRQQPELREGREHLFLDLLVTQGHSVWALSSRCATVHLPVHPHFTVKSETGASSLPGKCALRILKEQHLQGLKNLSQDMVPTGPSNSHVHTTPFLRRGSTGTRAKAGIPSWCDEGSDRLEPPAPEADLRPGSLHCPPQSYKLDRKRCRISQLKR